MATVKFFAALGALMGMYIAAVLQAGPDQTDANLCKLLRRFFSNVPEQCVGSIDDYGTVVAIVFVLACVVLLIWDLRRKVPVTAALRRARSKIGAACESVLEHLQSARAIVAARAGRVHVAAPARMDSSPETSTEAPAAMSATRPRRKRRSKPVSAEPSKPSPQEEPLKEENLVAKARFLYDPRSSRMTVINKQNLDLVTVDPDTSSGMLIGDKFIARFSFYSNSGPFRVSVTDTSNWMVGRPLVSFVVENEVNFVKILFQPQTLLLVQSTTEITVSFYWK